PPPVTKATRSPSRGSNGPVDDDGTRAELDTDALLSRSGSDYTSRGSDGGKGRRLWWSPRVGDRRNRSARSPPTSRPGHLHFRGRIRARAGARDRPTDGAGAPARRLGRAHAD